MTSTDYGHTPTRLELFLHRLGKHAYNWFWSPRPVCVICGKLRKRG